MLKDDVIWPKSRRFKSRSEWEPIGFFSESLCNATLFDIKLGFFSSSAINVLSDGFAVFLYNGGKMRMVINDVLSEEDKRVLQSAGSDSMPFQALDLKNLSLMRHTLSVRDMHFFDCLAWLIRNDRLEIRVVRPKSGCGIAHSKIGVFSDGGNKVAFDGSCNFSRMALIENQESISAFCDWDGESDALRVADIENDFNVTFNGDDSAVRYIEADSIRTSITDAFADKELHLLLQDEHKLISQRMKSSLSKTVADALERTSKTLQDILHTIEDSKSDDEDCQFSSIAQEDNCCSYAAEKNEETMSPCFPYGAPRAYQMEAFDNWKNEPNRQKGLFAMATGTGKTLTSLNCLLSIYNKYGFYKAIILVPTVTLVDQWADECHKFHFDNIIKVCSKNADWRRDINNIKVKECLQSNGGRYSYIIISTYASFAKDSVFDALTSFPANVRKQILLIADEAHNMGSKRILNKLEGIKFPRRIGLSATPERQFDDEANKELMDFFGCEGGRYTYEYTMQEAIDNGYLCRYYYYPHVVELTPEEMNEYIKVSVKLAKFYNHSNDSFNHSDDLLKRLLLKRKRIVHKAKNKESVFKHIIEERYKEKGDLRYTLVYVPEGNVPDDTSADIYDESDNMSPKDAEADSLIDVYTKIVHDISPTTTVKKFVSGMKDRENILKSFADGSLQVLTSMKCLDEGVDVPRSEMAVFCSSTGNPRQFIQRRGRILRLHKDKYRAVIHDLVVVPVISEGSELFMMERNLLASELRRVRDFALMSENADYALDQLDEALSYYDLSMFK